VTESGSARVSAGGQSAEAALGEAEAESEAASESESETEAASEAASESETESESASASASESEIIIEPAPEAPALEVPAPLPELLEEEVPGWRFGADLAPFVGMSSFRRGRGTRHLSIGLLGTLSGGLEGVAASSGVNVVTGDATGAMLAAGANWTHGTMRGAQIAAGGNVTVGDVRGAQLSAGVNIATGAIHGLQASSGVNYARGGRGLQLGSLNIQSGDFDGVQVGVVNIARKSTKLSLGLVNVVRGGRTHLEVTYGLDGFGFAMVKHGGERWHSIYSLGGRPGYGDEDSVLAGGLGLGGHFPIGERFALDLDLVVHYLHDFTGTATLPNEHGAEILSQLRLVGQLELHERFALVFGASVNTLTTYADESTYVPWAKTLHEDEMVTADGQIWRHHLWPSVFVGVRAF
jgi:hypothetical protein